MSYRIDDWKYHIMVERDIITLRPEDKIIYVLTVDDVIATYETSGDEYRSFDELDPDTQQRIIYTAQKSVESLINGGGYTWYDAIYDAIEEILPSAPNEEDN